MTPTYRKRYKKRRTRKEQLQMRILMILIAVILLGSILGIIHKVKQERAQQTVSDSSWDITDKKYVDQRPELDVELLPVNEYSRPGLALKKVRGIVVHQTKASSHFVIGLDGEIVQCIPCNEIAYASNNRNSDTIAIECCIPDDTGKFNDSTYQSLLELTTWLIGRYDLGIEDVIRHYDVTGKNCPKYFVEHESAWEDFHDDLAAYIEKNGVDKE